MLTVVHAVVSEKIEDGGVVEYDSTGCFSCAFRSYFRVRSSFKRTFKNLRNPKNLKT